MGYEGLRADRSTAARQRYFERGAVPVGEIAGPILGSMAALGPGPGGRPVDADEMGDPVDRRDGLTL